MKGILWEKLFFHENLMKKIKVVFDIIVNFFLCFLKLFVKVCLLKNTSK